MTVPLGVLKRSALTFSPSLPKDKQAAIHRLGYGVLNKCVLLFPFVFWDDTIDTFGHVDTSDDPSDRGLFYLFYQYSGLSGGALLGALVAGEGEAGQGISMSMQVQNLLIESNQYWGLSGGALLGALVAGEGGNFNVNVGTGAKECSH